MTGKLPSFFKETIRAMLNLCLPVYLAMLYEKTLYTIYEHSVEIPKVKGCTQHRFWCKLSFSLFAQCINNKRTTALERAAV